MSAPPETLPALISAAERALAVASNFDEVKAIRDQADGLRAFARKMGADTRRLDIIKVKAERIIGQQLKKQPKARGTRGQLAGGTIAVPPGKAPKLADLGISKKQSSRWQQLADIPDERFETYVATASEISTDGALKINALTAKKTRRQERDRDLIDKTRTAATRLGTKLYNVIYADPPWRFEPYSRETGMDRAADGHYPTMTFDEIAMLKIPAATNCVLFLWATAPMLLEALDIMATWGFDYKTHFIWAKPKIGTGYWNRNQHELLLLGIKGKIPAPVPGDQYPSLIPANLGKHSEKPAHFAEIIEDMFPTLPRLEMFARQPRLGWDVWGAEVE